jgi:hypothetical protein
MEKGRGLEDICGKRELCVKDTENRNGRAGDQGHGRHSGENWQKGQK